MKTNPISSSLMMLLVSLAGFVSLRAETGMGLVVSTTSFRDLRIGDIYRIDLISDIPQTPTSSLGNGTSPRFSPDGKRFCYIKNVNNKVTLIHANIDGGDAKTFNTNYNMPGNAQHAPGQILEYGLDCKAALLKLTQQQAQRCAPIQWATAMTSEEWFQSMK